MPPVAADRDDLRAIVDAALKQHGDLGVYGDLSAGLDALEKQFSAQWVPAGDSIRVNLAPLSGEGHDFSFVVSTATHEISDVVVGVLEPEPEF